MGRYERGPEYDEECFWRKVDKGDPGECWTWRGARAQGGFGYGSFRRMNAHRWIYIRMHGPLKRGTVVMHSCDNKLCVNPAHLSAGTQSQNMQDASRRGRLWNRLSDETVEEIRRRRMAGESSRAIAADLGLNASHIRRLVVINACPACSRFKSDASFERSQRKAEEEHRKHAESRLSRATTALRGAEAHHDEQARLWADNEGDGEADLNAQYHSERRDVFTAVLAEVGRG